MLEALLIDWPGTLLLVSHDRAFIDHVVTSTLVFEGDGRVQEYVGGYTDWLRQRRHLEPRTPAPGHLNPGTRAPRAPENRGSAKPSYKEQREFDQLPGLIEAMELEQQQLNAAVAAPGFYKDTAETIHQTLARLAALEQALLDAYARWDELDSRSGG